MAQLTEIQDSALYTHTQTPFYFTLLFILFYFILLYFTLLYLTLPYLTLLTLLFLQLIKLYPTCVTLPWRVCMYVY